MNMLPNAFSVQRPFSDDFSFDVLIENLQILLSFVMKYSSARYFRLICENAKNAYNHDNKEMLSQKYMGVIEDGIK